MQSSWGSLGSSSKRGPTQSRAMIHPSDVVDGSHKCNPATLSSIGGTRRLCKSLGELAELIFLYLARRGLRQVGDNLDAFRPVLLCNLMLRHQRLHRSQIER